MTDETKKGPSRRADQPSGEGVFEKRQGEIRELDGRILELLARRASILNREITWRRSRGKPATDPGLEKQVWASWEESARALGLDTKLLRQLFGLVNLFGRAPGLPRKEADPFGLAPRKMPVDLDLAAPRCLRRSLMWTLMAAATGQALTLTPAVFNDPLIELIKALNQAGAHLSWTEDSLESAPGDPGLDFEDKLLFAGETPFTFFALLAQALRGAGRCKFAGGPQLKLMDIGPLNHVLPALGARLISLNPHAPGLPARLECGGDLCDSVDIPDEIPAGFAAALALTAWSFPRGLVLRFAPGSPAAVDLEDAVSVLNACGVTARLEPGRCLVPPAEPRLPAMPDLPPDPVLCSYLLAMPAFIGGRVRLSGPWTPADLAANGLEQGLTALGLGLTLDKGALTSVRGAPDGRPEIAFGRRAELFPLALVLGLASERPCRLAAPADQQALAQAAEMLERLGASFEMADGAVLLTPAPLSWTGSYSAPNPHCILALALIAWLKTGVAVDNPGELTAVWPRFWNLYNALPTGRAAEAPRRERTKDETPKPRRIRVRGNHDA